MKTYVLEICLEQGVSNNVIFNDQEAANSELEKIRAKMGTRYSKNAEETVEVNGPAEKLVLVAGRIQSAAVVDKFEHHRMQEDTTTELGSIQNKRWIQQTREIIDAGLGDYIKK